jgi:hypothetical protein
VAIPTAPAVAKVPMATLPEVVRALRAETRSAQVPVAPAPPTRHGVADGVGDDAFQLGLAVQLGWNFGERGGVGPARDDRARLHAAGVRLLLGRRSHHARGGDPVDDGNGPWRT